MIARLLRRLWCVALALALSAASLTIYLLGPRIGVWAAGLLGIAAVAALHPVAIAVNFIASRLAGDPVPVEHRLSPWRAIRMFDAEVDASVRGVWFANPFLAQRPAPVVVEPTRRWALLFVHGYFCNRAVWHSFMRDAASRGYRCEAITLPDPFAPIDSQVAFVEAALASSGAAGQPVAIVAHSMGGVVARALMQRVDERRVAHVVTLGTPHRGAWSARFANSGSGRDMRIGSARLQRLEQDEAAGRGLPRAALTSVWSHHDDVVFPQSTSRVDGATNIAIGGCGHVALLYDRRVRTIVFDRLAALQDAAATPAS